jgi:ribonuclease G
MQGKEGFMSSMSKEILINVKAHEKRIAILENGVLEEFYVERPEKDRIVGNIYKGVVKTVVPGMEAAFIDLGFKKDGFLFLGDVESHSHVEDLLDLDQMRKPPLTPMTPKVIKPGEPILVQVAKDAIGTKGPRLTTDITLPARFVVMMPNSPQRGISRRIEGEAERRRLRKALDKLPISRDTGLILRTNATGKSEKEFDRDAKYLSHLWREITHRTRKVKAPSLVHKELDLTHRILRDLVTEDFNVMWVDDKNEWKRIYHFLRPMVSNLRKRLIYYGDKQPLFSKHKLEPEIEKVFNRKVYLKSGGHILIEPTESLVAIDVNTGRFTGTKNLETTAFQTNREAAVEIARQLKLRDIGGIVIIDFIDMNRSENRRKVNQVLQETLEKHKAKTNVLRLSELGLVELTRQRQHPSIQHTYYQICPQCHGVGMVKSVTSVVVEILGRINRLLYERGGRRKVRILAAPDVSKRLQDQEQKEVKAIEKRFRAEIRIDQSVGKNVDQYQIEFIN